MSAINVMDKRDGGYTGITFPDSKFTMNINNSKRSKQ